VKRSTKFEYRNPKQARMIKTQNPKQERSRCDSVSVMEFRISGLVFDEAISHSDGLPMIFVVAGVAGLMYLCSAPMPR